MSSTGNETVPAPKLPSRSGLRKAMQPPRVPYEFVPFALDDYAPESDPLRDIFPLKENEK